jgi:hypothetical protein
MILSYCLVPFFPRSLSSYLSDLWPENPTVIDMMKYEVYPYMSYFHLIPHLGTSNIYFLFLKPKNIYVYFELWPPRGDLYILDGLFAG